MWHTYWSKSSFPFYFLSPCSSRPSQGKVRLLWSLPYMSNGRQTNQAEFLGQHFISPGCRRTRVNLNQRLRSRPVRANKSTTGLGPRVAYKQQATCSFLHIYWWSLVCPSSLARRRRLPCPSAGAGQFALARWQDAAAFHARPLAPANLSRRSAAGWSWHDHKHPLAKPHVRRSSSSITCRRSRKLPRQLIEPSAASGRTWTPPGAPQGEAAQ
jgi:hypothetical protein